MSVADRLREKEQRTRRPSDWIPLLALAFILGVAGMSGILFALRAIPQPPPPPPETITLAAFNAIADGMPLADVESLLGRPGNLLSSAQLGESTLGGRGESYDWTARDGGKLMVVFADGRSMFKVQTRLR